jgi:hypothetical protein
MGSVHGDPVQQLEVGARETTHSQAKRPQQLIHHKSGGRLSVRPADMNDRIIVLRRSHQIQQHSFAIQDGHDLRVGPSVPELAHDLRVISAHVAHIHLHDGR